MNFPETVEKLIKSFAKLPGIGKKSAERFVFYLLDKKEAVPQLAKAISDLGEKIHQCSICGNIAEGEQCPVCRDERRDPHSVCVVENFKDLYAIEASGGYRGQYHVLMGLISPLEGIGPDKLRINELVERVKKGKIKEVILAMSSGTEGDTTCLYLADALKSLPVKVSRLASGIPVGGDIEHADGTTLARAIEGRHNL